MAAVAAAGGIAAGLRVLLSRSGQTRWVRQTHSSRSTYPWQLASIEGTMIGSYLFRKPF